MITLPEVLSLGTLLFCISVAGIFLNRKNIIILLMCIELMLNAVNLQLVAAASHWGDVTGWVYAVFAIAISAAEVAIGLAIVLSMYGQHETISLDEVNLLKN